MSIPPSCSADEAIQASSESRSAASTAPPTTVPRSAQLGDGGLDVVGAAGADGHRGPFGEQGLGDGATDALRRAGDQRLLAGESEIHTFAPELIEWLVIPSSGPPPRNPAAPISLAGHVLPGDALVDPGLAGQPEHPLADDVALHLVGPARRCGSRARRARARPTPTCPTRRCRRSASRRAPGTRPCDILVMPSVHISLPSEPSGPGVPPRARSAARRLRKRSTCLWM